MSTASVTKNNLKYICFCLFEVRITSWNGYERDTA